MYENGGNSTHRLLDGHPELFVYPFESQPGTKYVQDHLTSLYPVKYRWPILPNSMSVDEMYHAIIDEECKVRAKTPYVSKFRDADFDFTDKGRLEAFRTRLEGKPLTRANVMHAFFDSTFDAWKNVQRTGKEKFCVGYSPIIGVDGEKIIKDLGDKGAVLHVTRNPFSAYADTKKRAMPLSIEHYLLGWVTSQYYAKLWEAKYPEKFFVLRFEDIVQDPKGVLGGMLAKIGVGPSDTLGQVSWNGKVMPEVYPWGTVRTPTPEANLKTAQELSPEEIREVSQRVGHWLDVFGYRDIESQLSK